VKAAVLGAGGQVGRALRAALPTATSLTRADLDIGDAASVAAVDWSPFDVIINAAAFTAVDAAETPEGRESAWRTNACGVAHLARAADEHDVPLVQFSSEYVFDGRWPGPIPETAPLSPLSAYGASKAAGDVAAGLARRHYLIRTTWVTGDGNNFVRTMLGLARRGVRPTVVADQIGRLTFADDLASAAVDLLLAGAPHGTYNITGGGDAGSWADVARAVFALAGHSPSDVSDTTTAAYFAGRPTAAARPLNSVLALGRAESIGLHPPDWRDRLKDYVTRGLSD
jgi:dTDP-4-dehydrorhamnose 3,5-epimerase